MSFKDNLSKSRLSVSKITLNFFINLKLYNMSRSLDFMNWMLKIQNIYYTDDNKMHAALESIKKQENANTTPTRKTS